jgi:pectinesterase
MRGQSVMVWINPKENFRMNAKANQSVMLDCGAVVILLLYLATANGQADLRQQIKVSPDGKGDFRTVQEAVDHVTSRQGAVIFIAPGRYPEKVNVAGSGITLVGTGQSPAKTVITWGASAKSIGSTFRSGTVTVSGDGFEAENLSIVNTWWQDHPAAEDRSQAVALQLESDRAVLDRVRIISGQDTLFANSRACHGELTAPCRADRQFYNDCFVEGNVDYIFGEAKAVFSRCEFHSRPHSGVMITAQSRHSPLEDSGYYMLHCHITGENEGDRIVFGRPWRDYSTVLFYDTEIDQKIDDAGWSEWGGRLKTSTYREYRSHGPGVNGGHRSVAETTMTADEENRLSAKGLLSGEDQWDPDQRLQKLRALIP